jgi:hypothetical protein
MVYVPKYKSKRTRTSLNPNKDSITLDEAKERFNQYYNTRFNKKSARLRAKIGDIRYNKTDPARVLKPNEPGSAKYMLPEGPRTFDMEGVDYFPEGTEYAELEDPEYGIVKVKLKGIPKLKTGNTFSEHFKSKYNERKINPNVKGAFEEKQSLVNYYWDDKYKVADDLGEPLKRPRSALKRWDYKRKGEHITKSYFLLGKNEIFFEYDGNIYYLDSNMNVYDVNHNFFSKLKNMDKAIINELELQGYIILTSSGYPKWSNNIDDWIIFYEYSLPTGDMKRIKLNMKDMTVRDIDTDIILDDWNMYLIKNNLDYKKMRPYDITKKDTIKKIKKDENDVIIDDILIDENQQKYEEEKLKLEQEKKELLQKEADRLKEMADQAEKLRIVSLEEEERQKKLLEEAERQKLLAEEEQRNLKEIAKELARKEQEALEQAKREKEAKDEAEKRLAEAEAQKQQEIAIEEARKKREAEEALERQIEIQKETERQRLEAEQKAKEQAEIAEEQARKEKEAQEELERQLERQQEAKRQQLLAEQEIERIKLIEVAEQERRDKEEREMAEKIARKEKEELEAHQEAERIRLEIENATQQDYKSDEDEITLEDIENQLALEAAEQKEVEEDIQNELVAQKETGEVEEDIQNELVAQKETGEVADTEQEEGDDIDIDELVKNLSGDVNEEDEEEYEEFDEEVGEDEYEDEEEPEDEEEDEEELEEQEVGVIPSIEDYRYKEFNKLVDNVETKTIKSTKKDRLNEITKYIYDSFHKMPLQEDEVFPSVNEKPNMKYVDNEKFKKEMNDLVKNIKKYKAEYKPLTKEVIERTPSGGYYNLKLKVNNREVGETVTIPMSKYKTLINRIDTTISERKEKMSEDNKDKLIWSIYYRYKFILPTIPGEYKDKTKRIIDDNIPSKYNSLFYDLEKYFGSKGINME